MFHLRRTFRATILRADRWRPSQSCQPVRAAPVEEQTDSPERPVLPTAPAKAKTFAQSSWQLSMNPKQLKLLVNGKQKCVLDSLFLLRRFFRSRALPKN